MKKMNRLIITKTVYLNLSINLGGNLNNKDIKLNSEVKLLKMLLLEHLICLLIIAPCLGQKLLKTFNKIKNHIFNNN